MDRSSSMHRCRVAGFTLIELMIAVAVVGILAAIAYPSYSAFVRKSNRTDATRTMMQDAQALQRCYSQAYTYAGCATAPAGTVNSPGGYYSITIAPAATTYTITATTLAGPQASDTLCKTFIILSSGAQTAQDSGGADQTKVCWGTN